MSEELFEVYGPEKHAVEHVAVLDLRSGGRDRRRAVGAGLAGDLTHALR